jgi:hypothetical protein
LIKTQKHMKKTVVMFSLAILLSCAAQAQVACGSFKIADQEVIYQQVFQDTATLPMLEKYYKSQPIISNFTSTAEGLQFDINDLVVDYKKFGFSQNAVPLMIQTGKFSGKVTVGLRDGRYRVTVKGLQFTANLGYKMITKKEAFTAYASKNSATEWAADFCLPSTLGLLDKAFTDKLQFKKQKDDW